MQSKVLKLANYKNIVKFQVQVMLQKYQTIFMPIQKYFVAKIINSKQRCHNCCDDVK